MPLDVFEPVQCPFTQGRFVHAIARREDGLGSITVPDSQCRRRDKEDRKGRGVDWRVCQRDLVAVGIHPVEQVPDMPSELVPISRIDNGLRMVWPRQLRVENEAELGHRHLKERLAEWLARNASLGKAALLVSG